MKDENADKLRDDADRERQRKGGANLGGKEGAGGDSSDWNPNVKPLDGSPVLTAVPQFSPRPGQTGAVPDTVAEHNARVMALATEAESKSGHH